MRLSNKALWATSLWISSFVILPVLAQAEPAGSTTTPANTVTTTATPASPSAGLGAKLELRPTWGTQSGLIDAQNAAEISYRFSPNTVVLYNQSFNFDLRNTKGAGTNFLVPDARFEADFNNLMTDRSAGLSFDYQPRLHVPTDITKRNLGLLTEFRHQFNLNKSITDTVSVTTSLIPALHAYSKAGGLDGAGLSTANPVFENRLEVVAKWNFARNWKLEVPLKFWQTRYRAFAANAVNNDAWAFSVTTKPEIMWAIDPRVSIGAAFETGSFWSGDLGTNTFGDAFKNAKAQLALIATI